MKVENNLPFAGTIPSPQTENEGMITGGWRVRRPVCDHDKVTYNLKYCKGCGLCGAVCPVGAITMAPELDFDD